MSTTQISRNRCTRTRLLNSLGMFRNDAPQTSNLNKIVSVARLHWHDSQNSSEKSSIGALTFHEKLKIPNSTNVTTRRSCSVNFEGTVSVVEIPSRYQYSDRIKKHIWSNSIEISEMAHRNFIEFEAEGFDWRKVVMDDEMYIDSINGDLVHPCHFRNDGTCFEDTKDDDNFKSLSRQGSFVC